MSEEAISEAELNAMEKRATRATDGPWREKGVKGKGRVTAEHSHLGEIAVCKQGDEKFLWYFDSDFIAHARDDVPRLVAEIRRLRYENQRLREI